MEVANVWCGQTFLAMGLRLIVAGLLATLALPRAPAWSQSVKLEAGQRLLARDCAGCHAIGRSDVSAHPAAPVFRELSSLYPVALLAEALAEGIMSGHPDMPVFEYQAEEVDQIIVYLESIQQK